MKTVTFFDTEEELIRLTGLSHEGLWTNDFDLDDLDWGFVSDVEWAGYFGQDHPYYEYWILSRMASYCCGFRHVEFDGRHYYMIYHG